MWEDGKEYYYHLRDRYNDKLMKSEFDVELAALFVFINKHCFNGLYRVNGKGLFNVPYNNSRKASVEDAMILEISNYLKTVTILDGDFERACTNAAKGDFVFIDSPYAPLNPSSFESYTKEGFEADDIIGTFAKMWEEDDDYEALIISSDKDLLQLISHETSVKLLKTKDSIKYNPKNFKEEWGFEPIRMIDYKALAGDPSDNIPGVKGIGDKTAINLLKQYDTIEDIYEHIDEIKGKMKEKLIADKESAFISKEIATIYRDVPIDVNLDDINLSNAIIKLINNEIAQDVEATDTYLVIKRKVKKKITASINIGKLNTASIPATVEIPLPPLNFIKIGYK